MQKHRFVMFFLGVVACAALARAADSGAPADYQKDLKRLQELRQMYGNASMVQSQPDQAAERAKELSAGKNERKHIEEKYADLLKQNTHESRDMKSVLRLFDQQVGQFEQALDSYGSPSSIDQDIEQALKMGEDAVKNKRHLYFGDNGGVKQRLTSAQKRYAILAAIKPDAPETAAEKKKLDDAQAKVKEMKASLNDAIIASNNVPPDQYSGADKAQLVELVKKKWAEFGVGGDVLKVGINSREWTRDTYWRFDGTDTFNKNDTSKIQGFVVVKTDDDHAVIHYINLVKDHMKNDSIETYFFEDPKAEPDVSRKLLVKNVK